jgi:hypothetical protein
MKRSMSVPLKTAVPFINDPLGCIVNKNRFAQVLIRGVSVL